MGIRSEVVLVLPKKNYEELNNMYNSLNKEKIKEWYKEHTTSQEVLDIHYKEVDEITDDTLDYYKHFIDEKEVDEIDDNGEVVLVHWNSIKWYEDIYFEIRYLHSYLDKLDENGIDYYLGEICETGEITERQNWVTGVCDIVNIQQNFSFNYK